MSETNETTIQGELEAIKKLLAYALLNKNKEEHSQSDIAGALGISQSQVSRMFSKGKAKDK